MRDALDWPGSAHRGSSAGAGQGARLAWDLRRAVAYAAGQPEPRRVVLTPGATHGINLAVLGVVRASGGSVPRVVTTQAEHNAVRRPLLALAARGEIDLVVIPVDAFGRVDPLAIIGKATEGALADLVVMSSASNVTGVRQPVDRVWDALRGIGTLLMVDASQTASTGSRPLAGDLIAFGAHKRFAGPPGIGALVIGERAHPLVAGSATGNAGRVGAAARIDPVIVGGGGHSSQDAAMPGSLPERFEAGTLNTPAMAGWLAAIENAERLGASERGEAHLGVLAARLRQGLRGVGSVRVFAPPDADATSEPIVSFTIAGFAPEVAAVVLESEFGIIVRAGLHCAPGTHEAMGTLESGGTIRASLGQTTTQQEVEALIDAVARMAGAG